MSLITWMIVILMSFLLGVFLGLEIAEIKYRNLEESSYKKGLKAGLNKKLR